MGSIFDLKFGTNVNLASEIGAAAKADGERDCK